MKRFWSLARAAFAVTAMFVARGEAQEERADWPEGTGAAAWLDFPVLDVPFNLVDGYTAPSMRQSLAVSTNFYQAAHFAIQKAPLSTRDHDWRYPGIERRLVISLFDVLTSWIPLSSAWMHEEWHRAVMSNRKIGSFNDVYKFPIGAETIAVSRVKDEDLARLKRDHPADQVRLSAAGMEAQAEQNLLVERRHFFEDAQTWDAALILYNHLNNFFYLSTCASGRADAQTDDLNRDDGADIPKRDFTGLDCTAWAYDLYRPDEPYSARGAHPSGIGINRYRKYSDLTAEEREFLRRQVYLSALNFADPFWLGIDRFHARLGGREMQWNATLRHHLTSFGYTLDLNLLVRAEALKLLLKLHNQFNDVRYFPGATIELHRWPLPWRDWALSATAATWSQPRNQRVREAAGQWGGLGAVRAGYLFRPEAEAYVGVEGKTPGWVAGNVYLERNVSVWTGVSIGLPGD